MTWSHFFTFAIYIFLEHAFHISELGQILCDTLYIMWLHISQKLKMRWRSSIKVVEKVVSWGFFPARFGRYPHKASFHVGILKLIITSIQVDAIWYNYSTHFWDEKPSKINLSCCSPNFWNKAEFKLAYSVLISDCRLNSKEKPA